MVYWTMHCLNGFSLCDRFTQSPPPMLHAQHMNEHTHFDVNVISIGKYLNGNVCYTVAVRLVKCGKCFD